MICSSCRQRLFSHLSSLPRPYSHLHPTAVKANITTTTTTISRPSSASLQESRRRHIHSTPSSSSTSPAAAPTASFTTSSPSTTTQPPSAPVSGGGAAPPNHTPSSPPPPQAPGLPISSIPGGEPLRGLGYLKNKPTVVALEDDQYPSWLWGLLDSSSASSSTSSSPGASNDDLLKVDLNSLTKKQRSKHMKKRQALLASLPKVVPAHEQATDLTGPGEGAAEHLERRREVVKSAREARRKSVRERNYLGGM